MSEVSLYVSSWGLNACLKGPFGTAKELCIISWENVALGDVIRFCLRCATPNRKSSILDPTP